MRRWKASTGPRSNAWPTTCAIAGRPDARSFSAGNGGSGGNANHLANDFLYALSKTPGSGLRVHSLSANPSVITCLANDEGYDQVFSLQLAVLARKGDVLIAFSGSGNSPNIVKALEEAKTIGMTSYAVLGYSGGKAKALADVPIHFAHRRHADFRGRPDDHRPHADAVAVRASAAKSSLKGARADRSHRDGGARKVSHSGLELVFGRDVRRFSGGEGHDVLATSRSDEPHEAFLPYKWQKRPGRVRFKRIDLNHDLDALKSLLATRASDPCRQFRGAEHGRRELASSRSLDDDQRRFRRAAA